MHYKYMDFVLWLARFEMSYKPFILGASYKNHMLDMILERCLETGLEGVWEVWAY